MKVAAQYVLWCLLAVLVFSLFIWSWQYPTTNDMWAGLSAKTSLIDAIRSYLKSYLDNNPRIGEFFRILLASQRVLSAAYCCATLSVLGFICAGIARVPVVSLASFLAIFLATIFFSSSISGVMAIYLPYSSNYVFGALVLFGFLAIYALALYREVDARWLAFVIVPVGFAAGLTNESTVPFAIAMVVIYCLWKMQRLRAWEPIGVISIIAGYAALFFAPGEGRRYGGVEYENFHLDISFLLKRAADVSGLLISETWPFLVLACALAILAIRAAGFGSPRIIIGMTALVGTFGMVAPLIVSPLLGPRLLFGSEVCLAISILTFVAELDLKPLLAMATAASAAGILIYLAQGYTVVFSYHDAFVVWSSTLEKQRAGGVKDATALPYEFAFSGERRFVMTGGSRTTTDGYPNGDIAQHYGFSTFRYLPTYP